MRANSLAARQSGRSVPSDGRRTLPAKTSSVTLFSRNKERPVTAAPMRHQACGTPRTVSGSVAPSRAKTKTSRPAARQDSTRRCGSRPPPATIPSLPVICPFRLTDGTAGVRADEVKNVVDGCDATEAFGGFVYTIAQRAIRGEQELVGVAESLDILTTEAAALNADNVQTAKPRPVPHHLAVRNDIALNARHAADHRVPADPDVLVDGAESAENSIIIDDDVARESGIVRHDHMVGDPAVVRDMHPDHEQAAVADAGDHPASGRPRVHRYVLADPVVAPDDERRFLPAIFEILRLEADRGERENARARPDRCAAFDHHVRAKRDPRAEGDMLADDAKGPDDDILSQHRPRRDDGRRVDPRHLWAVYSFRIIAANTASAIKLSPTFALPSNFHTLPR